jgi:hypothetical protein
MHIRDFCDDLFEEDFASVVNDDWVCPLAAFDEWLEEQSTSSNPSDAYVELCAGANSLPMPQGNFDACISNWAQMTAETSILSRNNKVQILFIPFRSRVRFDSPFNVLEDEWNLIEGWMSIQNSNAPEGCGAGYFNNVRRQNDVRPEENNDSYLLWF